MRTNGLLLLVLLPGLAAQAADVCNPADLYGPYAFQLTGSTDISRTPKPITSLGRIASMGAAPERDGAWHVKKYSVPPG